MKKLENNQKGFNLTASSISGNTSMISSSRESKQTTLSACAILAMISVMWVCTDTSYSFVYVNIANIKGNVFVNCIILGLADTCSNLFSGAMMELMPEDNAYQTVGIIGLVFSLVLALMGESIWGYFILFISIGGVGGMVNCMICIVEMQIEPAKLGTVL